MLLGASGETVSQQALVRSEIENKDVWAGEPILLIVTLFSPGPFQGTPAFELPDLPKTVFIKVGNAMVGSEEIDGKSLMTQRHEFAVYTQQVGEVVIPSFRVRFSGKPTFLADPEPMAGVTDVMRFQSKSPPGTESIGLVLSATDMEMEQTWIPDQTSQVTAGDVIQRTIVRNAEGTTAMLLPGLSPTAPDGVRVYTREPEVTDTTQRGGSRARRVDKIKYQFERPGTFALPEIAMVWWDPEREELQQFSLAGRDVPVSASADSVGSHRDSAKRRTHMGRYLSIALFVCCVLLWIGRGTLVKTYHRWQSRPYGTETLAVRKLRKACATNDAAAAYLAIMAWMRAKEQGRQISTTFTANHSLRNEWRELSRRLYGCDPSTSPWRGAQLWTDFCNLQRQLNIDKRPNRSTTLPPLNPTN